jgi:hypothetical protein
VSALWRGGLDAGKYLWRSGREKCFSLDIPFNRTFWREIKCARSEKGESQPPAIVFQEEGDSDTVTRGKWRASR